MASYNNFNQENQNNVGLNFSIANSSGVENKGLFIRILRNLLSYEKKC